MWRGGLLWGRHWLHLVDLYIEIVTHQMFFLHSLLVICLKNWIVHINYLNYKYLSKEGGLYNGLQLLFFTYKMAATGVVLI